jgi:hypothetical protein|tara:strand:+ start:1416 stop:1646 length:231 start_codon:yes stop_codon:yes gene_type:complete
LSKSSVPPNTQFKLSVTDIEIIELALSSKVGRISTTLMEFSNPNLEIELKKIRELLGRIHNQKNWFHPTDRFAGGG